MKRILVVDDSKVITDLIKLMLEKSGFGCMAANSAEESARLLQKEKFDLVLLDIAMPDVSGLDLLDAIKKDDRQKGAKVVLFTATSPTEAEMERYMAKGALGVIRKPVKKVSLLAELERYLVS